MAVRMKMTVFWDVALSSGVRKGGTYAVRSIRKS
jgi:hypothetical protein